MSEKMLKGLFRFLLLLLIVGGCDGGEFWLSIQFPDASSKQNAKRIRVFVIEVDDSVNCDLLLEGSASGYVVEAHITVEMTSAGTDLVLTEIGPGTRIFYIEVESAEEEVFLKGCAQAETGGGESSEVSILLATTAQ